jgi:glycosyltransferase involved in cell wall biosynthesis
MQRLSIVVVSNGITPYVLNFVKRVSTELPEYHLRTIYSYEYSMGNWNLTPPDSVHPLILGKGETSTDMRGILSLWRGFRRGQKIAREIHEASATAVMIQGYSNLAHLYTIEWCYRKGVPCLLWGDSNIKGDSRKGLIGWLKKTIVSKIVSRCTALLPCGSLGAEYFKKYGAKAEQIFMVPYEPDYTLIETAQLEGAREFLNALPHDPSRRVLLFSGRLVPVKRVDMLIDVFAAIAGKRPTWDLWIVGGGPLESELKQRVPGEILDRVKWIGFVRSPEAMAGIYRLADALVLPSAYEPWAVVVIEAVSAGLALVCSDVVGAAAEVLHDRKNGRYFQANDARSLENALLDVTMEENIEAYRRESRDILKRWRKESDPIEDFKRAIEYSVQQTQSGYHSEGTDA